MAGFQAIYWYVLLSYLLNNEKSKVSRLNKHLYLEHLKTLLIKDASEIISSVLIAVLSAEPKQPRKVVESPFPADKCRGGHCSHRCPQKLHATSMRMIVYEENIYFIEK
jgi:hypothetical protein